MSDHEPGAPGAAPVLRHVSALPDVVMWSVGQPIARGGNVAPLHLGRNGNAGVDQYTSFLKELDLILTSGYINGLLGVLSVLSVVPLLRVRRTSRARPGGRGKRHWHPPERDPIKIDPGDTSSYPHPLTPRRSFSRRLR